MIPIKRRRILLIEDEEKTAVTIAECLPCFDIETVTTFNDAKRRLFSAEYSAILLDLLLPDTYRETAAGLSRALAEVWPHIPIIVMTGLNPVEAPTVVIRRAGAEKVLRKPVSPEVLRTALIDCIAPRESKQEVAPLRSDLEELKQAVAEISNPPPTSDPGKTKGRA